MEALEYLKTRNRMCKEGCITCPASIYNNGYDVGCNTLMEGDPEKHIEIVERWGKLHPLKTRTEKLKELFPNIDVLYGHPIICPLSIEGKTADEFGCSRKTCSHCRKEYWEGEYVQK